MAEKSNPQGSFVARLALRAGMLVAIVYFLAVWLDRMPGIPEKIGAAVWQYDAAVSLKKTASEVDAKIWKKGE